MQSFHDYNSELIKFWPTLKDSKFKIQNQTGFHPQF